jgi:hypothetical protein
MARIKFVGRDTRRGALPMVCLVCGEDAVMRLRRRFTWHPAWVYAFIFAGGLPYWIMVQLIGKSRAIDLPMCRWHRHYWQIRFGILVASLVAIMLFDVVLMIIAAVLNWGNWVCWPFWLLFLVWFVEIFALQFIGLRAVEITDNGITLTNISPIFAEEFQAYRQKRKSAQDEDESDDEEPPRRRRTQIDAENDRERPPRRRRRDEDYDDDYDD